MQLNNIRLLVEDFDECFRFYTEKLGLTATWGKIGSDYASFDIGIPSGLSIFKSDLMAAAVGNTEQPLPVDCREKAVLVLKVDDVDKEYERLKGNGVNFVTEPKDMTGWGMRGSHFRDPEGNLIEIYQDLSKEKWDKDLLEDAEEFND